MITKHANTIRIIVAGSRNFKNKDDLYQKIDQFISCLNTADFTIEIVSGLANGPDMFGFEYATDRGYSVKTFKPRWQVNGIYDKSAGIRRNMRMADYSDVLLAFWDGKSSGTKHMIADAIKKQLIIKVYRFKI